jgi:hypothetical protein
MLKLTTKSAAGAFAFAVSSMLSPAEAVAVEGIDGAEVLAMARSKDVDRDKAGKNHDDTGMTWQEEMRDHTRGDTLHDDARPMPPGTPPQSPQDTLHDTLRAPDTPESPTEDDVPDPAEREPMPGY